MFFFVFFFVFFLEGKTINHSMAPLLVLALMGAVSGGPLASLDASNFLSFVEKSVPSKTVVAMFHVDWCHSCRRTLPFFKQAADSLSNTPNVVFAEFDCTSSDFCAKTLGIDGYPGLKILPANSATSTPVSDWITIPYYERDAEGISQFVGRVIGDAILEESHPEKISPLIRQPPLGRVVSVVGVRMNKREMETFLGGSALESLKLRFQLLATDHVPEWVVFSGGKSSKNTSICPSSDKPCLLMVPEPDLMELPIQFPWTENTSEFGKSWIESNEFASPSVWKIAEPPLFQYFTDQPKYKVFFIDETDSYVGKVSACDKKISSAFAFAALNGTVFGEALAEFGSPSVLILNNEAHDFMRFFVVSGGDSICDHLEGVVLGEIPVQFRGGLLTKLNYKFAEFLSNYFGIQSQTGRLVVLMGLGGGFIILVLKIASWFFPQPKQKDE